MYLEYNISKTTWARVFGMQLCIGNA